MDEYIDRALKAKESFRLSGKLPPTICNIFPHSKRSECEMEFKYEKENVRGYYCKTHQLWQYQFASQVVYVFEGEEELNTPLH